MVSRLEGGEAEVAAKTEWCGKDRLGGVLAFLGHYKMDAKKVEFSQYRYLQNKFTRQSCMLRRGLDTRCSICSAVKLLMRISALWDCPWETAWISLFSLA